MTIFTNARKSIDYKNFILLNVHHAEKKAPAANAERDSKLLFIKTFIKADGSRYVNFEFVTVQKDGMEVSISSHEVDEKVVKKEMKNGNILHLRIGLPFSSEWYLTETPIQERPDLVPTSDNNVSKGKLIYRFDGGAQTEQRPADVSVTASPENLQGISESKGTNNSVKSSELGEKIAKAEAVVNTSPTNKQKEAGNYKKGYVQVGVFDITIEQPKGSVRGGVDGDHIDVFLSDNVDGGDRQSVFVVDLYNEDDSFDEHKVMLGFNSREGAEAAYFANYDKYWAKKHKTVVTDVNLEDFEKWIDSSHRKIKAFAEYKSVKSVGRKELASVTMWKKKNLNLTDANRTETTLISDLTEVSNNKDTTNSPKTNELGEKNAAAADDREGIETDSGLSQRNGTQEAGERTENGNGSNWPFHDSE